MQGRGATITLKMIYWVIISEPDGTVVRRRPHGSRATAEEYAASAQKEYDECTVEIRLLASGDDSEIGPDNGLLGDAASAKSRAIRRIGVSRVN
jgi:hypothetical protein